MDTRRRWSTSATLRAIWAPWSRPTVWSCTGQVSCIHHRVGTVWYPPPTTYYSSSSQFAWGAATGFMMGTMTGLAIGAVAWGGGCCCCGSSTVNVNKTVNNYTVNGSNVYHNTWDSKTVVQQWGQERSVYRTPNSSQNNNVYASHDGNVYKKDDGSSAEVEQRRAELAERADHAAVVHHRDGPPIVSVGIGTTHATEREHPACGGRSRPLDGGQRSPGQQ